MVEDDVHGVGPEERVGHGSPTGFPLRVVRRCQQMPRNLLWQVALEVGLGLYPTEERRGPSSVARLSVVPTEPGGPFVASTNPAANDGR